MAKIEMIGLRFGILTVIAESPNRDPDKTYRYLCRCDCGRERVVNGTRLRSGEVISCGCQDRRVIRDETGSPLYDDREIYEKLYSRWHSFKMKKQPVCREWTVFPNFYKWAIETGYCIGAKLYRYDDNEPYSPDNCCWHMMKTGEKRMTEPEIREFVNGWNRTVNVLRVAAGLEPFPIMEDSE